MPGQSWCKSSVLKHSRIRLSLPFPVCASLDFRVQVQSYIYIYIYLLHIVYAEKAAEQCCHW